MDSTRHALQDRFPEPDAVPLALEHLLAEGSRGPVFYVIALGRDPRTGRALVQKISGVGRDVRHRQLWRFPSEAEARRFFDRRVASKQRPARDRHYRRSTRPLRWQGPT